MPWLERSWIYLQHAVWDPSPLGSWHLVCHFLTSWKSFCPPSPVPPRKPSGSPRTWPSFNSLPRAVVISSVFLQTWRQFIYFNWKECKSCCVGFFLIFKSILFWRDVTNTHAAPCKLRLVLSLRPRISSCSSLPLKAATNKSGRSRYIANWTLENLGCCVLFTMLFSTKLMFPF